MVPAELTEAMVNSRVLIPLSLPVVVGVALREICPGQDQMQVVVAGLRAGATQTRWEPREVRVVILAVILLVETADQRPMAVVAGLEVPSTGRELLVRTVIRRVQAVVVMGIISLPAEQVAAVQEVIHRKRTLSAVWGWGQG